LQAAARALRVLPIHNALLGARLRSSGHINLQLNSGDVPSEKLAEPLDPVFQMRLIPKLAFTGVSCA